MSSGSPRPHDAAAVRVFPPLVPLTSILFGIGLSRIWPIELGATTSQILLARRVGGLVVVVAIAVMLWTIAVIARSGQNSHPRTPTPSIIEHGPFRVSRNPIYLAMVMMCLGFAIQRLDVWILLLTPVALWILQQGVIVPEETYLEAKFGATYRAYKDRVRRWL